MGWVFLGLVSGKGLKVCCSLVREAARLRGHAWMCYVLLGWVGWGRLLLSIYKVLGFWDFVVGLVIVAGFLGNEILSEGSRKESSR